MSKQQDSKNQQTARRNFVKFCMGAVAAGTSNIALPTAESQVKQYHRSLLVNNDQTPVTLETLSAGENYIFHYPFVSTPCFLLDLGEPVHQELTLNTLDGVAYRWKGGVGPNSSLVAFSAICAHKLTHPAKSVSFISYRHGNTTFEDKNLTPRESSHIIYCCSERSVYDARQGAKVLGGPAPQPLATILLEHDARRDELYAVGTAGGELFNEFFEKFGHRIQLEYKREDITQSVGSKTKVMPLSSFSKTQTVC